jgi:hypothetical protein
MPDPVENALYVTRADGLDHYEPRYSRLYFGNEFCQRLIPGAKELDIAVGFAESKGLGFTLLTPYVTNDGMTGVQKLLDRLSERSVGSEVVFNDWGVFRLIRKSYPGLRPVLGRLLNKMKRGPRLMRFLGFTPLETKEYLRSCSLETPHYQRFLQESGIRRAELDNVFQGIGLDLHDSALRASIYVPYAFVTTTRFCQASACEDAGMEDEVGILECKKECRKYTFTLHHPAMPAPLFSKGNTKFVRNSEIPENLLSRGIDRIVFEPEIPM